MEPQKKREHVKGAWWIIVGVVALVAWCAQTGRNPVGIFAAFSSLFVLLAFWCVFCVIVAIIGGILGGGRK